MKFPINKVKPCPGALRKGLARLTLIGVASVAIAGPQAVFAGTTTINLPAAADAAMFEPRSGDPANADGLGPRLFIGRTGGNGGNTLRRSLLRFDVAGAIPLGATIDMVELTVTVSGVPITVAGFTSLLHRVTTPWNEGPSVGNTNGGEGQPSQAGDTTWLHNNFDTEFWSTPGGDYAASSSASVLMVGFGDYTFSSGVRGAESMVTDVQGWLDDPANNFGWIIRGGEGSSGPSAKRLSSREASSDQPVLTVTYTLAAPPPLEIPVSSGAGLLVFFAVLGVCGWWTLRRH